jgi:hypothetical protein
MKNRRHLLKRTSTEQTVTLMYRDDAVTVST